MDFWDVEKKFLGKKNRSSDLKFYKNMSNSNGYYLLLRNLVYFNVILHNFSRNLAQIEILSYFAKIFLSTSQPTSNILKKVQDVTWRARDVYVIRRVTRFLRRDAVNTEFCDKFYEKFYKFLNFLPNFSNFSSKNGDFTMIFHGCDYKH